MMHHPIMGMSIPDHTPQMYSTAPILDEFSRQQAISESSRRMSRGSSNGYRPVNAMRIVKPSSANNSPQSMMQRRRTLMNDGNLARRRQYALDQAILNQQIQGAASPYEPYQEPVKASRPMSWHPSSHIQQPQMHIQQLPQFDIGQYMIPASTPYTGADVYPTYNAFPPTPIVFSGHTSPVSTFSPLSLPFAATSQQQQHVPQCMPADTWSTPAYVNTTPYATANGSPGTTEPFPSYSSQSTFNWDTFVANGFSTGTAPPTPENYQQQAPAPEPTVPSEESIPYQALDEAEEEGEILVGMGLYDTPDKSESDPGLDHYKTTTSQLLGTTLGKGVGLKLEEAWSPPKDDEEDSNDEDDAEEEEGAEEE